VLALCAKRPAYGANEAIFSSDNIDPRAGELFEGWYMEIEANSSSGNVARKQLPSSAVRLLTPKEAAQWLKVSESWLAKARMRGDGPLFIKIGRSIRYSEVALLQWMKAHQRSSTSEQ
jgi:predicted DNA-binding transcriptional regulator AlpA